MEKIDNPLIFDFNKSDLEKILFSWGEPIYRANQIWKGLYQQLWQSPEEFTNLPRPVRHRLAAELSFARLHPSKTVHSSDHQTEKTLFVLEDKAEGAPTPSAIETVLMKYDRRRTLCISTQAGCAMGCVFCATGQMGFKRNLTSGEIIEQVIYFARQLKSQNELVTNIVVMGMGEPFHNYEATLSAIDRLNQSDGFNFGARRFTISTVGLIPAIQRFTQERRQVNLAVSLHAADDDLRSSLLPVNRKYPLGQLMAACLEYVKSTHRRLSFEWALIRDVNDTPAQAMKLARLLRPFLQASPAGIGHALCHVNVIPLNPTHQYNGEATTGQRALEFKSILEEQGIPCTIRIRRGIDIQAGCGQLATMNSQSAGGIHVQSSDTPDIPPFAAQRSDH